MLGKYKQRNMRFQASSTMQPRPLLWWLLLSVCW